MSLPEKLHECLTLALSDLEKCEEDPAYNVQMSEWHFTRFPASHNIKKVCYVCLAGSVMAQTMEIGDVNITLLHHFDWEAKKHLTERAEVRESEYHSNRFYALSDIATGLGPDEALASFLHVDVQEVPSVGESNCDFVAYSECAEDFKTYIGDCIRLFKEADI